MAELGIAVALELAEGDHDEHRARIEADGAVRVGSFSDHVQASCVTVLEPGANTVRGVESHWRAIADFEAPGHGGLADQVEHEAEQVIAGRGYGPAVRESGRADVAAIEDDLRGGGGAVLLDIHGEAGRIVRAATHALASVCGEVPHEWCPPSRLRVFNRAIISGVILDGVDGLERRS